MSCGLGEPSDGCNGGLATNGSGLQTDEQDSREAIEEVQQSIYRMVDSKISTARQEISARLDAAADGIRRDVANILGSGSPEVRQASWTPLVFVAGIRVGRAASASAPHP